MKKIEFRDLKKQYQVLKPKIDKGIMDAIASGAFIMGKEVRELEASLAEYVGVKHCISCANGTDALTLALKTWNLKAGEAVFVPDFTFFATAETVSMEGATPVFVDVDKDTFNMCPIALEEAIKKTISEGKLTPRVITTVDLFGLPANYPAIRKIADKYNLLILEDGAQGFGGSIDGKMACSFGDISITSFFPAKPLGCYGDGGALFTDNEEWANNINSLRVHGKGSFKYDNVQIGVNSRLDTIQAAILIPKFNAFKEYELEDINKAASLYTEKLRDIVKTPITPEGYISSWAQYTLILDSKEQRDALQAHLKEQGIPSMVYYPKALHDQSAYKHLGYKKGSSPIAEMLAECVLSLPIHPYIDEEDIELVCNQIKRFIK
jgi:UDP-2-acetamido-2-deoxy-ribo-hexuluronate aminotransferase